MLAQPTLPPRQSRSAASSSHLSKFFQSVSCRLFPNEVALLRNVWMNNFPLTRRAARHKPAGAAPSRFGAAPAGLCRAARLVSGKLFIQTFLKFTKLRRRLVRGDSISLRTLIAATMLLLWLFPFQ